jgi:hypothetical protein
VNTKLVLGASAIVLGAAGLAGTFLPREILQFLGVVPAPLLTLLVQLLAALLFAFAMVNWAARGSLIGGIYNRPIAIGNLTHFVIGAITVTKVVLAGERRPAMLVVAAVYLGFAVAFAAIFFRSPVSPTTGA